MHKQKLVDVLQNKDSKQEVTRLIRETIFESIYGIQVSFNENKDVEVHFTPHFFNQDTFRKGRYLNSLNYTKILRFREVMKTLAKESMVRKRRIVWVVNSFPSLSKENLNMKIIFYTCTLLNKKIDEITVEELLHHLRGEWEDIRDRLLSYGYSF